MPFYDVIIEYEYDAQRVLLLLFCFGLHGAKDQTYADANEHTAAHAHTNTAHWNIVLFILIIALIHKTMFVDTLFW